MLEWCRQHSNLRVFGSIQWKANVRCKILEISLESWILGCDIVGYSYDLRMHVHTCEGSFMFGFLWETTDMRLDDSVDWLSICILQFCSPTATLSTASSETPWNARSGWASPAAAKPCKATNGQRRTNVCKIEHLHSELSRDSRQWWQCLLVSDPVRQGLVAGQTPRIPFCPSDGQGFSGWLLSWATSELKSQPGLS